ncbi:acyltransferase family protein [Nonomuraea sp. NPDC050663]|uniref:acyltransferase family protein n=1 Tax=Nonomuraea sp. NPDC050663 TaxID=3364370 RepID=UPI0037B03B4D
MTDQPRLRELDALRFLAAFAVMAFHYLSAFKSIWVTEPNHIFAPVAPVTTLGILGVELFFLISGFVILMSAWGRTVGGFAVSRFARLYPAYWFTVLAIWALYSFTSVQGFRPKFEVSDYLWNLTMFQSAAKVGHASGVFWSLWAELRFYILMAVFVIIGITLKRCYAFMGLWSLGALAAEFTTKTWLVDLFGITPERWLVKTNEWLTLIFMPRQMPYFIAGMCFFLLWRYGHSFLSWFFVALSFYPAVWVALERVGSRVKSKGYEDFPASETGVVIAITLIYLLIAAVALGWLKWMTWKGLTILGALTYPLYLVHQTLAAVVIPPLKDSMNPWLLAALTMVIAIVVSYLVYALIDKPGQRLLRKLMPRDKTRGRRRKPSSEPIPEMSPRTHQASVP